MPNAISCEACGEPVTGRRRKYCGGCPCSEDGCVEPAAVLSLCRRHYSHFKYYRRMSKVVREVRQCAECGVDLPRDATLQRKYCSAKCKDAVLYRSDAYSRARGRRKVALRSDPAEREKQNAWMREYRKRAKREVVCSWCSVSFLAGDYRSTGCCPNHSRWAKRFAAGELLASDWLAKPQRVEKSDPPRVRFVSCACARCGAGFLHDLRVTGMVSRFCGLKCRRGSARDVRRARERGAYVEDVRRSEVFVRDNYCCQLCNLPLDMSQVVPHRLAPTIDHVVPLSQGGTHEMANVQAAHFICNTLKSDNYQLTG